MHGVKRIFFDGELDDIIELNEEDSRRLKTVLRAAVGDSLEILTPESLAVGHVGIVGKKGVTVKIDSARPIVKPNYSFTVCQCIAKREYMDFMVEKYAELGVTRLIPIVSARSLPALKANTSDRLNIIAREAALQSENEFVMEIAQSQSIERLKLCDGSNILFHERSGQKNIPQIQGKIVQMIIGPEGGFTDKETQNIIDRGFTPVTPLQSILKAETAAVLFAGIIAMEIN